MSALEQLFPQTPEILAKVLERRAAGPLGRIDLCRELQVRGEVVGEPLAGFLSQHHGVELIVEEHATVVEVG